MTKICGSVIQIAIHIPAGVDNLRRSQKTKNWKLKKSGAGSRRFFSLQLKLNSVLLLFTF
jgi:hypothetical protein